MRSPSLIKPETDRPRLPSCPRCRKTDVDEQARAVAATYHWFRCYGCGNVWYEPLR